MTKGVISKISKKRISRKCQRLAAIGVMAMMLAAALPINVSAAASGSAQYIGEAKAKAIALENAGISEENAVFLKVHLDREDGYVVYDVEFYSGDTEYDYEINAVSGEVYEFDREIEHHSVSGDSSAALEPSSPQGAANTDSYIGEAKAKSIALSEAGIAESQVRKMKAKLDREHRTMVYEVEFKSGQMEYEYDIDAVSGAILESDVEYDD